MYLSVGMLQVVRLVMTLRLPIRCSVSFSFCKIGKSLQPRLVMTEFIIKLDEFKYALAGQSNLSICGPCRVLIIDDFLLGVAIVQSFHELNRYPESMIVLHPSRKKVGTGLLMVCPFPPTMGLVYFKLIQAVRSLVQRIYEVDFFFVSAIRVRSWF